MIKMNNKSSNGAITRDLLATRKMSIGDAIAGPSETIPAEPDDFTYLCRICAIRTHNILPLFEKEGLEQKLVEKINKYLPIKVSKDDLLPLGVCEQCSNAVLAWHELVACCVQADASFRERISLTQAVTSQAAETSTNVATPHIDEDGINITNEVKAEDCFSYFELQVDNNHDDSYKLIENVTNGKKYTICGICNKKILASSRRRHARSHRDDKMYSCDACGLGFKDSGNLARHQRAVHTNHRPHACNICPKRFSRNSHLQDHLMSHSEGRNYVCDLCGKTSKSSNALRMHRKIHESELQFQCIFCESKFKRRYELYAHVMVHTGEKAHFCKCGKAFRLRSQLNRHARSHETKSTDVT